MVLVWQIADGSPNSPNFLPAKLSRYTVLTLRILSFSLGVNLDMSVHLKLRESREHPL